MQEHEAYKLWCRENALDAVDKPEFKESVLAFNANIDYKKVGPRVKRAWGQGDKHYDIHVPETLPPNDVENIMKKVPLITEKQKNDVIKSASAAKHALEHRGNNSKVILDLSEQVTLHFNDIEKRNEVPDVIDVECNDITDANNK